MKYFIYIHICILLKMPFALAQKPEKLLYEGNKLYENNDFNAAENKYRAAQKQNKTAIESYFNLGDALYSQGKFEESAKQFSKVPENIKNKEISANSYYNLGNSLLKMNKLDEGIEAYKKSLRIKPGNADAQYNLSYALKKKQQKQQEGKKQQQNRDQEKQQGKTQQEPQTAKTEMSKKEAERILNGLNNKEQNLRKRMQQNGDNPAQQYEPKPW